MTLETQTQKPDFANYTWFPGSNDRWNALSVSSHEGRTYVGLKGYDKRSGRSGFIQAQFDAAQLRALATHLQQLLLEG